MWLQAKCLHPHRMVLGSHSNSAVNATGCATLPHADVSAHEISTCLLPHHPNPEVSVLPHLISLSSHVTTLLYMPQLFLGYRKRWKLFRTK